MAAAGRSPTWFGLSRRSVTHPDSKDAITRKNLYPDQLKTANCYRIHWSRSFSNARENGIESSLDENSALPKDNKKLGMKVADES